MPYPTRKFRGKLPGVDANERRAQKVWLTSILPKGTSREDVADLLGVDRKTISTMLNPNRPGFGSGLTMLRYLRLAGALVDGPEDSRPISRLAALEDKVDEMSASMREAIGLLREARQSGDAKPEVPGRDGTDG